MDSQVDNAAHRHGHRLVACAQETETAQRALLTRPFVFTCLTHTVEAGGNQLDDLHPAEPARGGGHAPSVRAQIDEERRLGLLDLGRFQRFAADVRVHRDALRDTLLELKSSGSSIAAATTASPAIRSAFSITTTRSTRWTSARSAR